jgi:uncharacterized protein
VVLCAAGLLVLLYAQTIRPMSDKQIYLDSHAIFVEVADNPAERELGLSGHAPLLEGQGMLFVFDTDDRWGIWMKDMHFAIDIVWADAEGTVMTVIQNAEPNSYPLIFYPTAAARYVLELPAGYAERQGIAEGSKLVL